MDVFIRLYNQTPQRYRTEGKNKAKLMNTSTRFTPSLAKQAKTWSILRDTHCIRKVPSLHKVNHGESSSTKQKQEEIGKLQNKRRLFNWLIYNTNKINKYKMELNTIKEMIKTDGCSNNNKNNNKKKINKLSVNK